MSAYLIFHYNITDRSRIDELGPLTKPIVEKYKGKIVIADYIKKLEGTPYSHMVAYKFETQQTALDFYNSKEHQEISKTRNEITNGTALLVPELGNKHDLQMK